MGATPAEGADMLRALPGGRHRNPEDDLPKPHADKLACLAAEGKLAEGAEWVQESIIGSAFTGRYRWLDKRAGEIAPTIVGRAYVNLEATLLLGENDPFCWGIT